jgi:polar amino acid transport system substrate-binding protein
MAEFFMGKPSVRILGRIPHCRQRDHAKNKLPRSDNSTKQRPMSRSGSTRGVIIASLLLAAFHLLCRSAHAQVPNATNVLVVGIAVAPPFTIKNEDGTWGGLEIDLWRDIAAKLDLKYEFREMQLVPLLHAVADGEVDVAIGGLTVTGERERLFDFTHSFYSSGLGVAVGSHFGRRHLRPVVDALFSTGFLQVLIALVVLLVIAGSLVWVFERKFNPNEFGGRHTNGIGSGIWWAAVTVTGVGYGDKVPRTVGGRIVALICVFVGIVIISIFTGTVASLLTLSRFQSIVRGPEDLRKFHVGTMRGTTSEDYLRSIHVQARLYLSANDCLQAVARGEIDAFVFDEPVLKYLAPTMDGEVQVLPNIFDRQDYGIALPRNSPLLRPIDIALLDEISSPVWLTTKRRYLGN